MDELDFCSSTLIEFFLHITYFSLEFYIHYYYYLIHIYLPSLVPKL